MAVADGDGAHAATASSNLAVALHALGRLDEAIQLQRRALAYARRTGDLWNESRRLCCLGRVQLDLGRYTAAFANHRAAVERARQAGDLTMEAAILCDLAIAYRAAGRDELALSTLEDALPKLRATSNRHHLARAEEMLASLGAARNQRAAV